MGGDLTLTKLWVQLIDDNANLRIRRFPGSTCVLELDLMRL